MFFATIAKEPQNFATRTDQFILKHNHSVPSAALSKLIQLNVCEMMVGAGAVYHTSAILLKALPAAVIEVLAAIESLMSVSGKIVVAAPTWMRLRYVKDVHGTSLARTLALQPTILASNTTSRTCSLVADQLFLTSPSQPSGPAVDRRTVRWLAAGSLAMAAVAYAVYRFYGDEWARSSLLARRPKEVAESIVRFKAQTGVFYDTTNLLGGKVYSTDEAHPDGSFGNYYGGGCSPLDVRLGVNGQCDQYSGLIKGSWQEHCPADDLGWHHIRMEAHAQNSRARSYCLSKKDHFFRKVKISDCVPPSEFSWDLMKLIGSPLYPYSSIEGCQPVVDPKSVNATFREPESIFH